MKAFCCYDKGIEYTGTASIDQSLGGDTYRGSMTFSYNNQHGPKEVRQSLLVSVEGNKVVVNGASPVVLRGSAGYNADNFFLTVVNARMMKGYNKDVNGTGGTVVLSR